MPTEKVRPGEIISSDIMNFVLNKLEELEVAVNNLGNLNKVRVDQITPVAGAVVDGFIQISGANFLYPPGNNIVRIAGELVTEYGSPSTTGILTCRVPGSINIVSAAGEEVVVSVENAEFGVTESVYTLFPKTQQPEVTIASILNQQGSANLVIGSIAIITGTNFSPDSTLNQIQFERVVNGELFTTEVEIKDVIDTNPEAMKIQIEVPDMADIGPGQTIPVPVTVTLTFAERSAQGFVTVRR